MKVMPLMGNPVNRQNFTGTKVMSVDTLIKELKDVEASDNIPFETARLVDSVKGGLYTIQEAVATYFPQSEKLKKTVGLDHSTLSHPRHSL